MILKFTRPDRLDWLIFISVWVMGGYFITNSYVENHGWQVGLKAYGIIVLVNTPLIIVNVFCLIPNFFKVRWIIFYFLFFILLMIIAFPIETRLNSWLVPEVCNECQELLNYIIINGQQVTIFSSFFLAKQYLQFKNRAERIEKEKVKAELDFLKAQINPHFYFNTLNNLYGLALLKSDKAPNAILKLSEIMEYVIYDARTERVPLEKEMEYLKNYVELECLRLEENAKVQFEVEGDGQGLQVAPLLLLPLVENAFKHGTSNAESVDIQIVIQIDKKDSVLDLSVKNYFESSNRKMGLGIENLRKRLDLMYLNVYELKQTTEGDYHISELKLQL
ncbi:MAG: sensor histidine kinase [Bacteroidota bacterium]